MPVRGLGLVPPLEGEEGGGEEGGEEGPGKRGIEGRRSVDWGVEGTGTGTAARSPIAPLLFL